MKYFILLVLIFILGCTKEDLTWTLEKISPKVITLFPSEVKAKSAKLAGKVIHNGGLTLTERGFYICKDSIFENSIIIKSGTEIGDFYLEINNLEESTRYYVKSFAVNEKGKSFGEPIVFETKAFGKVITNPASDITTNSAILNGQIISDGGSEIQERGFFLSENSDLDISGIKISSLSGQIGTYDLMALGLNPSSQYFFKAYVLTDSGISFGETQKFTTAEVLLPTVSTSNLIQISAISVQCGGNVTNEGSSAVHSRGICYSTGSMPTINSKIKYAGSGMGPFNCLLDSLQPGGNFYYIRAFASNNEGTSYGNQLIYTTGNCKPTLTTTQISNITSTSVKSGGIINNNGGFNIQAKGVTWSLNINPTILTSSFTSDGIGSGSFSSDITGLTPNKTYYLRSYATNYCGTEYGNQLSFTTLNCTPILTTNDVSNITSNSAVCGGIIISDGGSNILSKGVIWSTNQNPTVELSSKTNHGGGIGNFTSNLTGLIPSTTYYIRAYATNICGTVYGQQRSFATTSGSFIGTVIIGTSSYTESQSGYPTVTPFGTNFEDVRHIYLIKASEIKSQGGNSGKITQIMFHISRAANISINNFVIKYGTTTLNSLVLGNTYNFAFEDSHNSFNLVDSNGGWVPFNFKSPFYWDGQTNLIFEICFNNSRFDLNSTVYYSNSGFYSNIVAADDNAQGCSLPFENVSTNRPNIKLVFN